MFLDLSGQNLKKIPAEIQFCVNLIGLDLSDNKLNNIKEIENVKKLRALYLKNSGIKYIDNISNYTELNFLSIRDSEIQEVKGLEKLLNLNALSFSSNKFVTFPKEIGALKNLIGLWFSNNSIGSLPEEIGLLENLNYIDISTNKIDSFPESIGNLINLKELNCRGNRIKKIPASFGKLCNLSILDAAYNRINELPLEFGHLNNLIELNLSLNQISNLPKTFALLSKLRTLDLSSNIFENEPNEVLKLKDLVYFNFRGNKLSDFESEKWNNYPANKLKRIDGDFIYFKISMAKDFRTSFKQYLLYFKDFVRLAKNLDIHFEVKEDADGLKIEVNASEKGIDEFKLNEYFMEYLGFVRKNFDNINFEGNPSKVQEELLKLQLKQQVVHLEQQLELLKFKNTYFKDLMDKILQIQLINPNQKIFELPVQQKKEVNISEFVILIERGELKKALEAILGFIKLYKSKEYINFLNYYSNLNEIEMEVRNNIITKEHYNVEKNKIKNSVLQLLDLVDFNNFSE